MYSCIAITGDSDIPNEPELASCACGGRCAGGSLGTMVGSGRMTSLLACVGVGMLLGGGKLLLVKRSC